MFGKNDNILNACVANISLSLSHSRETESKTLIRARLPLRLETSKELLELLNVSGRGEILDRILAQKGFKSRLESNGCEECFQGFPLALRKQDKNSFTFQP